MTAPAITLQGNAWIYDAMSLDPTGNSIGLYPNVCALGAGRFFVTFNRQESGGLHDSAACIVTVSGGSVTVGSFAANNTLQATSTGAAGPPAWGTLIRSGRVLLWLNNGGVVAGIGQIIAYVLDVSGATPSVAGSWTWTGPNPSNYLAQSRCNTLAQVSSTRAIVVAQGTGFGPANSSVLMWLLDISTDTPALLDGPWPVAINQPGFPHGGIVDVGIIPTADPTKAVAFWTDDPTAGHYTLHFMIVNVAGDVFETQAGPAGWVTVLTNHGTGSYADQEIDLFPPTTNVVHGGGSIVPVSGALVGFMVFQGPTWSATFNPPTFAVTYDITNGNNFALTAGPANLSPPPPVLIFDTPPCLR